MLYVIFTVATCIVATFMVIMAYFIGYAIGHLDKKGECETNIHHYIELWTREQVRRWELEGQLRRLMPETGTEG
jgi:hypothetical protein